MKKILKKALSIITVAGLLLAVTSCGEKAQNSENNVSEEKIYKVGITQFSDHPSLDNCREGFIEGMKNSGFVDGVNVEFDFKSAQSDMTMTTQIAQNFANNKKDLVCGIATPSAQSLYSVCASAKIPVIFNAISDPVEAKLAVSEKENMSGVTGIADRLPVKEQLEMIRKILPEAKTIGIMYTVGEANSVSTIKRYKELAPDYGFEIIEKGVSKQAEVTQATDYLLTQVDCISNMTDNTVVSALGVIIEKANAKNIPVFGSEEEQVKNGCVACSGIDYFKLGELAGAMAARVLNGEDIDTINFETINESSVFVSDETAARLGITIPETLEASHI